MSEGDKGEGAQQLGKVEAVEVEVGVCEKASKSAVVADSRDRSSDVPDTQCARFAEGLVSDDVNPV